MTDYQRYGIYFVPEEGELAAFGASWLGWDIATGQAVAHPELAGLGTAIDTLTATPRRYGFHATLKPPFSLAAEASADALDAEVSGLCRSLPPAQAEGLSVMTLGGFVALCPTGPADRLNELAAELVQGLDAFRAPPDAAELERRRRRPLSPRQEQNLAAWGYPYVMEDFRFHITLTGKLSDERGAAVQAALQPALAPLLPAPFRIEQVALVGEDAEGMFHLIHRYPLRG